MDPNPQIASLPNDRAPPILAMLEVEDPDDIESLSDTTYTLRETSKKAEVSVMTKNINRAKAGIDKEVAANALNNESMSYLKG